MLLAGNNKLELPKSLMQCYYLWTNMAQQSSQGSELCYQRQTQRKPPAYSQHSLVFRAQGTDQCREEGLIP